MTRALASLLRRVAERLEPQDRALRTRMARVDTCLDRLLLAERARSGGRDA